jgi:hypothetical protein
MSAPSCPVLVAALPCYLLRAAIPSVALTR